MNRIELYEAHADGVPNAWTPTAPLASGGGGPGGSYGGGVVPDTVSPVVLGALSLSSLFFLFIS